MKKNSWLIVFTNVTILFACNNASVDNKSTFPPTEDVSATRDLVFDKLVGIWKLDDKNLFERWTMQDMNHYQSQVFTINNIDTVWEENATIFLKEGNWIFENAVSNQNQGKAIQFTSSKLSPNSIQFTNITHDFPQHVNYSLINDTILHAFIAGPNEKGGMDTVRYNYHRYFK